MPSPILLLTQGHAGDRLGARLVPAFQKRFPAHRLIGTGGQAMQDVGVELLARADHISAMGWTGLLPEVPKILNVMAGVIGAAKRELPACVVAVDVWQPLRVIHKRAPFLMDAPHVCYLPPGPNFVGGSRVHKAVSSIFRSIITPFPHQARLFEEAGGRVRMAAHAGLAAMLREIRPLEWDEREPILALLPGSRNLEVRYGLPVQYEAAKRICKAHPELRPIVCCADARVEAQVKRDYPGLETHRNAREVMARARFGLICSGTAALEASVLGCPGVVTYNASPLQRWEWKTFHVAKLAEMRAAGVASPYIALPNIISGQPLYPELLDCTPDDVTRSALEQLSSDLQTRSQQLTLVRESLGWDDAGEAVAAEAGYAMGG